MKSNENAKSPLKIGERGGKNNNKAPIAHLKISEDSKRLLKNAKQHGENYTDTIERLVAQNEGINRGGQEGGKLTEIPTSSPIKGDFSGVKENVETLLDWFGLTPKELSQIFRKEQTIRALELRGSKQSYSYLVKPITSLCWLIGAIIMAVFVLPQIIGLLGGVP